MKLADLAVQEVRQLNKSLVSISDSLKELVKIEKEKMKRIVKDERTEINDMIYKTIKESIEKDLKKDENKT